MRFLSSHPSRDLGEDREDRSRTRHDWPNIPTHFLAQMFYSATFAHPLRYVDVLRIQGRTVGTGTGSRIKRGNASNDMHERSNRQVSSPSCFSVLLHSDCDGHEKASNHTQRMSGICYFNMGCTRLTANSKGIRTSG